MAKGFVLCADDFALTDGVSRSILSLLALGKLSATGAMTNRPHWRSFAAELAEFGDRADLGLHFNLTCAEPLGVLPRLAPGGTFPALGHVVRGACLSASIRAEIAEELVRQLEAFEDALGRPPDFIDGHQHVHAMPGVRGVVLDVVGRRHAPDMPYLRDPSDGFGAILARGVAVAKSSVISALATGFRGEALRRGFRLNRGFSGVSPFDPSGDFAADLARYVAHPGPAHLVMCHPGFIDGELARLDPVIATRPIEHQAIAGFAPPPGLPLRRLSDLLR